MLSFKEETKDVGVSKIVDNVSQAARKFVGLSNFVQRRARGSTTAQRLGCCQKYTEEEVATHNSIKYKKTSGATIKKSRFHYHLCEDFFLKKSMSLGKVSEAQDVEVY